MNGEHAERWMMIISDDLREANRDLPGRTGEPAAYLRARIAENEAILGWLQRSRHAGGARTERPHSGTASATRRKQSDEPCPRWAPFGHARGAACCAACCRHGRRERASSLGAEFTSAPSHGPSRIGVAGPGLHPRAPGTATSSPVRASAGNS